MERKCKRVWGGGRGRKRGEREGVREMECVTVIKCGAVVVCQNMRGGSYLHEMERDNT